MNSLIPMGPQMFSCFQECRAPSHLTVTWEGKHDYSKYPLLPPSFPHFIWACCHMIWNIHLVSWRKRYLCIINPVFSTNLKHSPVLDTVKKINHVQNQHILSHAWHFYWLQALTQNKTIGFLLTVLLSTVSLSSQTLRV